MDVYNTVEAGDDSVLEGDCPSLSDPLNWNFCSHAGLLVHLLVLLQCVKLRPPGLLLPAHIGYRGHFIVRERAHQTDHLS